MTAATGAKGSADAPPSPDGIIDRAESRVREMRRRTFGPASEEPFRRRPRDAVRLVIAAGLLFGLARHVGDVTNTEASFFEVFNSLPGDLQSFFVALYRLGALWAVGLVVAAALLDRRWRLARDLALSGALAWIAARAVGVFVVEDAGLRHGLDVITRAGDTPNFPLVRLAVVVAIVAAASPYVTRPTRRIGAALIAALALASLYLGTAFPNDALAGVVLGWGIAAAVHFAFGSPGGRPTTAQVAAALTQLGADAHDVHLSPTQPAGSTLMLGEDDRGPLWIKVIGRDEADAQLIAKVWRFLAYKDSGPTLFLSRLQQVEHEAYTSLLVASNGGRVPAVVLAGTGGPGAAVLVARRLDGTPLADMPKRAVTQKLLRQVWQQVAMLHETRIAHGALNTANVVVTSDGPALTDFSTASSWTRARSADDVAELLASTAAIVGEQRAIDAAHRVIGQEALAAALSFLQPAALSRRSRELTAEGRTELHDRLERLRKVGARVTGTEEPELQELRRVRPSSVLMAVGTLVAAAALLGQVGSPGDVWNTIKDADWAWVALALLLSMATNVGFAVALMGTVPVRLPLGPTTEVQVAMSFSNLAIPAVGGTAMQIRFLQKRGVDLASAVASGGLLATLAGLAVQVAMFGVALWLAPNRIDTSSIPTGGIASVLLGVAAFVGVLAALVLGIPRLRNAILPPIKRSVTTLGEVLRSPRRLVMLISGNVVATFLSAFCLLACLEAFGAGLSFWTLLALNIGVGTIASLVPIPGGGTAVSSVGLSGALVAFGIPEGVAVAAVLTNQIVMTYLPALPGWLATRDLMRHEYL